MEIVFLQAKKKIVKEISKNSTTPYPLVKKFTSHHFDYKKTQQNKYPEIDAKDVKIVKTWIS